MLRLHVLIFFFSTNIRALQWEVEQKEVFIDDDLPWKDERS